MVTPASTAQMRDETLQVISALWTEPYATFEGRYYQISGVVNAAKGVQQPHVPFWIGGNGKKGTLRLAARDADACNLLVHDPQVLRHTFDGLRAHGERRGRA